MNEGFHETKIVNDYDVEQQCPCLRLLLCLDCDRVQWRSWKSVFEEAALAVGLGVDRK